MFLRFYAQIFQRAFEKPKRRKCQNKRLNFGCLRNLSMLTASVWYLTQTYTPFFSPNFFMVTPYHLRFKYKLFSQLLICDPNWPFFSSIVDVPIKFLIKAYLRNLSQGEAKWKSFVNIAALLLVEHKSCCSCYWRLKHLILLVLESFLNHLASKIQVIMLAYVLALYINNHTHIQMKKTFFVILMVVSISALNVPACGDPRVPILKFGYWNGSVDTSNSTQAQICHNSDSLIISWTCIDNEVIAPYQHCNDPLYNADAVEVFIATPQTYPTKYYEIQISPNSQLFFADITNPKGICSNLGTEYQDCGKPSYIANLTPKGWKASLSINLNVIGRGKPLKQFWVNLFRIDKSTHLPTRYLSWQPTNTATPCFHVPAVFQQIVLI